MASITDGLTQDDETTTPPPKKGSLLGDIKRGVGNIIQTTARAGQDVGINVPSINAYGQQLVNDNPATVNTGADIVANPLTTVREGVGENVPQIGLNVASGKTGQVVGGVIGAGVGALTRNPANIARFEQIGQKLGGYAGFAAPTFAQEYGTIRQGQDETGTDNKAAAITGAAAATGLEQLGESKVVKRLFKIGGEQAVEQAGKSVIGDIAKEAGKTALTEGATEAAQTGVERIASGQSLTDQDAQNDFLLSTVKGAAGGAGFGGATRGAEHILGRVQEGGQQAPEEQAAQPVPAQVQQQAQDDTPIAVQPPGQAAPAVVDPSAGPLSRAVTAGVDNGDIVGTQVAGRASIPGASDIASMPPDVINPPALEQQAPARPTLDQLTDFRPEAKPVQASPIGEPSDGGALDAPNFGQPEAPRTLPDDHPLLQPTIEHDTPERQQLRQAIVDQHFQDAEPAPEDRKPIAYVMGGGGASGKGTILEHLKSQGVIPDTGAVEIDPDRIKTGAGDFQGIPEYKQLADQGDSRAAAVVHEESSAIAKQALDQAAAGRYDVVLDRTLGDGNKGQQTLQALKQAGYEVRLYGVTVDPQQAVQRAVQRAADTGRHVPINDMLAAHRGFASNFENYANIADSVELYDNDVKRGEPPVLLASKGDSGLEVANQDRYNNFLARSNINESANTLREINPETTDVTGGGTQESARPGDIPGDRGDNPEAGAGAEAGQAEVPGGVPAGGLSGPNFNVQRDGSAIIEGDRRQLAAQLKTANIPALPATAGVRVAAKYIDQARTALTPSAPAEQVQAAGAAAPGTAVPLAASGARQAQAQVSQASKPALPHQRVQGEVGRLTKRWKGGPDVQVVSTFNALPEGLRNQLDPRADAAYDGKGTIYVVGDRMTSGTDIRRVLAHEAYAHYGVKGLLGPQYETFLGRVNDLKETDANIKKASDEVYQKYGELDPEAQADEIVANLAEGYKSLSGRAKLLMAQVITAGKDFVRNRLGLNMQWSNNDILDMVARAKRQVEDNPASAPTPEIAQAIRSSVPPGQMQSFNGWTIPSDKLADHLAAAAGNRIAAYKSVAGAKSDTLRGLFQDYFLPVKRVQEGILSHGGQITEDADVYGREELYYGRTGEQLRQLEEDHVKPLVREMTRQGISQQDLELYLYAKFAPDRNARIAAINPKMPDGGSGMTNADAAQIMADFQAQGLTTKLDALSQRVQAMNKVRLDALENGGLVDPTAVQMWRSEANYVPLKGLAQGVKDDTGTRLPVGGGFSVGGKEAWRALGRKSRATDILANTVAQTEQAIIRAEKNRVAQALLKLATDNPNDKLWSVDKTISKPTFDKATGEVKYNNSAVEPNAVIAKVGGEEHRINLYDKRLLESVKNMGAAKVGAILRAFSSVNRFLSLTRTTLAPEFVLSNFARDLETAAVNLGGEQSAALAAKTVRDTPLAIKAVWGLRRGKLPGGEWGRWAKEFADNGALTSFVAQRTVEEQQKKIQSLLKESQAGVAGSSRRLIRATMDLIEDTNGAVENGVRLSSYANARRQGMSAQEAARLAKNLTVNFNRKGSAGAAINAMYLFYNASIQGSHRFLSAMKSPKVRATMAATALLGFGLGFHNRMVGGKDDDGEDKWDKVQDWEKARNLIIMHSDGSTTKIPLPYTYNLPFLLGNEMADMVFGKKEPSSGAANMLNAMIDAFNPVGNVDFKGDMTEQVAKLSTPSVAAPFLDLALNKNHFGGPILPEQNPYAKVPDPDSERYFPSTNPAAVAFARELNRITGGNKVKPGAIDISPASMTYVFDYLTGGTGSFFDRVGTAVGLAAKGEPVPSSKIPFARVFMGNLDDNRVNDTYYKARDDANQKFEEARLAAKPGGFTDATDAEKQEMALGRRLAGPLKTAEMQLKKVSDAMKYAKAQNDDDRVKELKDRQRQIMLRFNTVYFKAKEEFSQEGG